MSEKTPTTMTTPVPPAAATTAQDEKEAERARKHAEWLEKRAALVKRLAAEAGDRNANKVLDELIKRTKYDNMLLFELSRTLSTDGEIGDHWMHLMQLFVANNCGQRTLDALERLSVWMNQDLESSDTPAEAKKEIRDVHGQALLEQLTTLAIEHHAHNVIGEVLRSETWSVHMNCATLRKLQKYGTEQLQGVVLEQQRNKSLVHEEPAKVQEMLKALRGGIFETMAQGLDMVDEFYNRTELLHSLTVQGTPNETTQDDDDDNGVDADALILDDKARVRHFVGTYDPLNNTDISKMSTDSAVTFASLKLDRRRAARSKLMRELESLCEAYIVMHNTQLEPLLEQKKMLEIAESELCEKLDSSVAVAAKPQTTDDEDDDVDDKVVASNTDAQQLIAVRTKLVAVVKQIRALQEQLQLAKQMGLGQKPDKNPLEGLTVADNPLMYSMLAFMMEKQMAVVKEAAYIEHANTVRHDALERQRAEQREQTVLDIQNIDAESYFD